LTLSPAEAGGTPSALGKSGIPEERSSFEDEPYADAEFERLQKKFPDLFGSER
jgi:hypothetical protein